MSYYQEYDFESYHIFLGDQTSLNKVENIIYIR